MNIREHEARINILNSEINAIQARIVRITQEIAAIDEKIDRIEGNVQVDLTQIRANIFDLTYRIKSN